MNTGGSARTAHERTLLEEDDSSSMLDESTSSNKRQRETYRGLCPLCGVTKNLSHFANHRAVVVASHADPDTATQFESHGVCALDDSFRICKTCASAVLQSIRIIGAVNSSWTDYLDSIMQEKTTRHPAKSLRSALASQGQPLIALFKSIISGQHTATFSAPLESAESATPRETLFAVGDLVNLPRRKQANVNMAA